MDDFESARQKLHKPGSFISSYGSCDDMNSPITFENLTKECIEYIFSFLSVKDLGWVGSTNSKLFLISNEAVVWDSRLRQLASKYHILAKKICNYHHAKQNYHLLLSATRLNAIKYAKVLQEKLRTQHVVNDFEILINRLGMAYVMLNTVLSISLCLISVLIFEEPSIPKTSCKFNYESAKALLLVEDILFLMSFLIFGCELKRNGSMNVIQSNFIPLLFNSRSIVHYYGAIMFCSIIQLLTALWILALHSQCVSVSTIAHCVMSFTIVTENISAIFLFQSWLKEKLKNIEEDYCI